MYVAYDEEPEQYGLIKEKWQCFKRTFAISKT